MRKVLSHNLFIALILFALTFIVYRASFPEPRLWYNHYVHLSYSILQGRIDVPTLPEYYQDKVVIDGKTILPFGPTPALLLLPFVAIFGLNTSQPLVSMFFGALNVSLCFLFLRKLGKPQSIALLLSLFLGFGTVHWYASIIGTTWFFAHISAIFFLFIALLLKNKNSFLSGITLSFAGLARYPTALAAASFVNFKNLKASFPFLLGLSFLAIAQLFYNWVRFGDIFQTGYFEVYGSYAKEGGAAGIYRNPLFNFFPSFSLFDPRNIPLHLYTLFLMVPERLSTFPFFKPSPYGMSIILTSPLLLYILKADFKSTFSKIAVLAIIPIALLDFMHYSQGWVQFGYRFALDFMPFILIILSSAIRKITPLVIVLFLLSILINFWGVLWGINLGW